MAKQKTIIVTKPHYIGEKPMSEAFHNVLKNQIIKNIEKKDLQNINNHGIINISNLLSGSEEV